MQSYLTSRDLLFNLEATNSSEAKRKWKQSIKDKWDYKCAYCGSDENLTLDHIISKSRGGHNKITNVLCACKNCNKDKADQLWSEWFLKQDFCTIDRINAIIKWQNEIINYEC